MRQRTDAPLIKYLFQVYGAETAKDWQRIPLVMLPGQGFMLHLTDEATKPHDQDALHLPWNDMLFDIPVDAEAHARIVEAARIAREKNKGGGEGKDITSTSIYERYNMGRWWCRVRPFEKFISSLKSSSPWYDGDQLDVPFNPEDFIACDMWVEIDLGIELSRRFAPHPFTFAIDRTDPFGKVHMLDCGEKSCTCLVLLGTFENIPDWRESKFWDYAGSSIAGCLFYLTQCNEYLTRVTPPPSRANDKRAQKGNVLKPWLNETLPHYILLDPQRAAEYGHPSKRKELTGERHSPLPHHRRGHWAALKHDRFARNPDGSIRQIWVKPAWIGGLEWQDELDQRYKVILPEVG